MPTTTNKKTMSFMTYLVVMIAVSAVVIGAAALIGQGLVREIITQYKVQDGKNKAIAQLEKNLDAAPKLAASYRMMGEKRELLEHALPVTADYPIFVKMMENLALQSNMRLNSVTPSQSMITVPSVGDYPIVESTGASVSIDGDYNSLLTYLKNIENSARPIRLTAIQLSGTAKRMSAQMEMSLFYQGKASVPFKTEAVK